MIGTSKSVWGFDPRTISGCQLWLDAADTTTISPSAGGTLTSWTDKSGTSKTITINSAPSYSTTGFNGNYPSMTFTSGNNLTLTIPSVGTGDIAVFVVWRQTTSENPQQNVFSIGTPGGGTETALGWNNGEGRYKFYRFSGSQSVNTAATNNVNVIGSALQVSGLRTLHINGVAPSGTGTESYNQTNTTAFIGGGTFPLVGQLAEVIFYIGTVTTAQQQQIEGYLAHKWGLVPPPSTTPLTIPGCQLWLDAADPSGNGTSVANGTAISTWTDKSGSGNNASQSTSGSRPSVGTVNNRSAIVFSGSPVFMTLPNITSVPISIFMVGASTQNVNNTFYISLGAEPNTIFVREQFYSPVFFGIDGGSGGQYLTSVRDLNTHIWSFTLPASANGIFAFDGSVVSTSGFTLNANTNFTTNSLGSYRQNSADGNIRAGISEVIIYNSALTTTQRQTIEGYLSRKWGIGASSIPSTHPFYSIRPHLRAFQPIDVPGCQLWLDADDALNFTGSTWNDKSGTNNHAVNGTPGTSSMPTVTTWSNGRRAARFVKESKNSIKTTNSIPIYVTYFIVARIQDVTGATGIGFLMINNVDGQRQLRTNSTSFPVSVFFFTQTGGTNMVFGSFSQGQGFLFSGTVTSGSAIAYGNGVQSGTSGVNDSSPSRHYFGSGDGDNDYLSVDFAEMLIYDSVLTTSQRQQVEGYLAHKWGLTPSLPVISPLSIPGCALWLDAADSSTVTGTTTVTQWRDKSGNARHLGVGSGTTSYSSSAIVLNSSYMFVNSPVNLTNVTVFIVTKSTGGNNQTVFTARPNSGWSWNSFDGFGFYIDAAVPKIRFYGDSNNLSEFNVNTSTTRLFSFQSSGTSINSWLDGTSQSGATLSSTRTSTAQGFAIGAEWNRDQNAYINVAATCSIYEIITYNNALTTTQRQQIEGYLARKWGISISATLPSPHSFKSFPPASLPFSPRNISGLQLWLDAADQSSLVLSGSSVTQWNDKSGNGKHATATGTPTYLSGGGMNFNGSSYFLNQTFSQNLSQRSIFIVFNETSHTDYAGVFPLIPTPNSGFDQLSETGLSVELAPNDYGYTIAFVGNYARYRSRLGYGAFLQKAIYYDSMNETTGSGYFNGVNVTNETATYTAGTCSGYGVGGRWQGGIMDASYRLNGVVHEILFYNRTLTNSERQTIEGYLAQKWGLTGSLPSSHPFKKLPA